MAADYTLYCFAQSGNCFKAALMLNLCGAKWTPRFVDFFNGETRTSEYRASINEMGEVPVLDDGARRLTQSGAILSHLAAKHGAYGGDSDDERLEVLRWLLFDNHKFTSYFASYRFMRAFGPAAPDTAVLGWLRGRLDNAFGIVDQHLADRAFLVGAGATIADLSLSGYLFYPEAESGYEIVGRFPHIAAWLERLRQLPGWANPYDVLPGAHIAPRWVSQAAG